MRPRYHATVLAADAPTAARDDYGIMRIIERLKQPGIFVVVTFVASCVLAFGATYAGYSLLAGATQPLALVPTP